MNEPLHIEYRFELQDAQVVDFDMYLDPETLVMDPSISAGDLPDWAELGFSQCPHCPLSTSETAHCPPAVNLVSVVSGFEQLYSHESVFVTVKTAQRTVSRHTTMQKAVASLMGLIMATSECPHLTFFRSMARFHLPFSDARETIFRAISSWLLYRFIEDGKDGKAELDLDGLREFYGNVHEVNHAFAERLRRASSADAAVNALVALDVLGQSVHMAMEDQLKDLEPVFKPLLQGSNKET